MICWCANTSKCNNEVWNDKEQTKEYVINISMHHLKPLSFPTSTSCMGALQMYPPWDWYLVVPLVPLTFPFHLCRAGGHSHCWYLHPRYQWGASCRYIWLMQYLSNSVGQKDQRTYSHSLFLPWACSTHSQRPILDLAQSSGDPPRAFQIVF